MSDNMLVRASRDGDQFHYLWAARRCLRLLSATSRLVAITIEGASPSESSTGNPVEAGKELIDVAEYYGSQDVDKAALVRYIQLKHSTLHPNDPWGPSGLDKTLRGFAERYKEFRKHAGSGAVVGNLEFGFVSNRPIGSEVVEPSRTLALGHTVPARVR